MINGGGLPLFLPSLILPIFAHINTFAHISSGEVFSLLSAFGTDDQHDDVFQLGGIAGDRLRDFLSANMQSLVFTKRSH
ncbi:hypothetical protein KZ774_09680 [Escherichia coli]|nr:hypothetical protein [Escherichia coli]